MKETKVVRRPYRPHVVLVDGNALAFRSLYSHETLSVKIKGKTVFTGMAYGFIKMLASIKKKFKPKEFIVAWDGGSKRKKETYPGYKAGRKIVSQKMSYEDIVASLNSCRIISKLAGIRQYRVFGEEGDDVMSSFVDQNQDKEILLLTNDHDMFQLLDYKHVKIFKFKAREARMWTRRIFMEEHKGLEPRYYSTYLAIAGCPGDEVPGIKGLGEIKTLDILMQVKRPTLKRLYKNIDKLDVTSYIRKLLTEGEDTAKMFLPIVKLRTDLELTPMYKSKLNKGKLIKFMKKLKFRSLLDNEDDMETICGLGRSLGKS